MDIHSQALLKVWYKGHVVGDYSADLIVEERVVNLSVLSGAVYQLVNDPSSRCSRGPWRGLKGYLAVASSLNSTPRPGPVGARR